MTVERGNSVELSDLNWWAPVLPTSGVSEESTPACLGSGFAFLIDYNYGLL